MPLSRDPERRGRQVANLRPAPAPPAGNRRHVVHAGYAAVAAGRMDAKRREVFEAIAVDVPLRGPDGGPPAADAVLVVLLCRCLCRLDDVGAYLDDHGIVDAGTGQLRPAVDLERRLRGEAREHAEALGMSPRSRASLSIDLAHAESALERHVREHYGGAGGGS